MRDWLKELDTAFVASLKIGSNAGKVGNPTKKASHLKPQAVTKIDQRSYRSHATGNRSVQSPGNGSTLEKQSLSPHVTKATGVTDCLPDDILEERAALIEYGANVPRDWAEGFARLDLSAPPPEFSDARWRTVVNDSGRFIDRWAEEAARLGWQATDVFGVHPCAPPDHFDPIGLVPLIGGGDVISITDRSATIRSPDGQILIYLRRPSNGAVCLWDRVVQDALGAVSKVVKGSGEHDQSSKERGVELRENE